jgi:hypothetical protein
MKRLALILPILVASFAAQAAKHDLIWQNYCDASKSLTRKSATVPIVNYNNKFIQQAVVKLNQVEASSFYQYKEIEKIYGLCSGRSKTAKTCKEGQVPKIDGLKIDTHNFLTILCGEFRDNVKMLDAKLKWVARMNIVQDGKQRYTPKKDVFEQITGKGYRDLVSFNNSLYTARENALTNADPDLELEQNSVSAVTVCENRYIFSEYLAKDKSFIDTNLSEYEAGLIEFKKSCKKSDLAHYYEYRGDGNFKAHSLESNAFIYVARDFANSCSKLDKARKGLVLSDQDCTDYYSNPFKTRENISMQGLRRIFFYPSTVKVGKVIINIDEKMQDFKNELVFITEDLNNDKIADMIILEEKLQGNGEGIGEEGAHALINAREMVTELRREALNEEGRTKSLLYQLAGAYKKAVHYIASSAALHQLKDKSKINSMMRAKLKKANMVSKNYIRYKAEKFKLEIAKIAIEDEYTAEELFDYVAELEELITTDNFKGVIIITDVVVENRVKAKYNSKLNEVFTDKKQAWHRVTVALDRHTDWYQIDTINMSLGLYSPTYSPWVASSYYINKSDDFTKPGYAMGMSGDGHRHWMFVQKVPIKRWFSATDLREAKDWINYDLDIHNTWFDETTFSRSGLGQHEQGWDRFGTTSSDEVGQIFYMWRSTQLEE